MTFASPGVLLSAHGMALMSLFRTLLVLLLALPVLLVLAAWTQWDAVSAEVFQALSHTVLPDYVWTTVQLCLLVGLGVVVVGLSTAVAVTLFDFPGRRVFEWALRDGKDHFTPTDQVIASPPIVQLAPGSDALVRLLRLTGAPVDGEKAYRLVIDEVPNANRVRNMGVNLAVRYALPLFFVNPDASQSKLVWTIENRGGRKVLVSANSGDRSVRISDLAIGGVKIAPGLAGYVLGRSERVFELPRNAPNAGAISAETDKGRLNAQVGR